MGKTKGKGKKKKTKEELEAGKWLILIAICGLNVVDRLEAEEEERILLETEAERHQEEEALRKAQEEEERLERKKLRREELDRLNEEATQSRAFIERTNRYVQHYMENKSKHEQWHKFVSCNPLPDVHGEHAELNTYLDSIEGDKKTEVDKVFKLCEELDQVLWNFENLAIENRSTCGSNTSTDSIRGKILQIFDTQVGKIDQMTAYILANPESFLTPKLEVLETHSSDHFKFGLWVNMASKGFRMKIIDFPGLDIVAEIPKTLASQSVALRVLHTASNPLVGKLFSSLGGIIFLEALRLPPPCTVAKGWTMQPSNPCLNNQVQRLDFNAVSVFEDSNVVSVAVKVHVPETIIVRDVNGNYCPVHEKTDFEESQEETKIIEKSISATEDVLVGAWNPSIQQWTTEGITDSVFDPIQRILSFTTTRMSAISLLQHNCADAPFLFWAITPDIQDQTLQKVMLTLRCEKWRFQIEIHANGFCVLQAPLLSELKHILYKPVSPFELFAQLSQCGIQLVQTGSQSKDHELEYFAYQEISTAVTSSFGIFSSKWNQTAGESRCVAMIYEVVDSVPDFDPYTKLEIEQKAEEQLAKEIIEKEIIDIEIVGKEIIEESPTTEKEFVEEQEVKKETKKGKKKKGKKAENTPKTEVDQVIVVEEEEIIEVLEKDTNVTPRAILFEVDQEIRSGLKCSLILAKEQHDDFNSSSNQVTHLYLEGALGGADLYSLDNLHTMQDSSDLTPLRQTITSVLQILKPLSFSK